MKNRTLAGTLVAILVAATPVLADQPRVVVENNSDTAIFVSLDGRTAIVEPGRSATLVVHMGLRYRKQALVTTTICGRVEWSTQDPPAWALDENVVGEEALTGEFLAAGPNEPTLKKRVGRILDELDRRKPLGRKTMADELEAWFRAVRKNGLGGRFPSCATPWGTMTRTPWFESQTYYGFGQRVASFRVTGSKRRGYDMSGW